MIDNLCSAFTVLEPRACFVLEQLPEIVFHFFGLVVVALILLESSQTCTSHHGLEALILAHSLYGRFAKNRLCEESAIMVEKSAALTLSESL